MRTIREDKGLGAVLAGPDEQQPRKYFAIRLPSRQSGVLDTAIVSLTREQTEALRDEADAWLNQPQGFWWMGVFVDSYEKLGTVMLQTASVRLADLQDLAERCLPKD